MFHEVISMKFFKNSSCLAGKHICWWGFDIIYMIRRGPRHELNSLLREQDLIKIINWTDRDTVTFNIYLFTRNQHTSALQHYRTLELENFVLSNLTVSNLFLLCLLLFLNCIWFNIDVATSAYFNLPLLLFIFNYRNCLLFLGETFEQSHASFYYKQIEYNNVCFIFLTWL